MNWKTIKLQMLINEARFYIGLKEQGINSGQLIEFFQSTMHFGLKEPWCMTFIQFCVFKIDQIYNLCIDKTAPVTTLFKSPHCLSVWNNTSSKIDKPEPGSIVIWQHAKSSMGHSGIVESILDDQTIITIEGNTSSPTAVIREGDGVYHKKRSIKIQGDLKILGYLMPWG